MALVLNFHQRMKIYNLQCEDDPYVGFSSCMYAEPSSAMFRSSPVNDSKRMRREFVWQRFLSNASEFEKLSVPEMPNLKVVSAIKDMSMDLFLEDITEETMRRQISLLDRFYERVSSRHGSSICFYQQKQLEVDVATGEAYSGVRYIGRAYSNGPSQLICSKILNTIYKGTHVELDIVCSYSTMLWNAFGDASMDALREYATSQDVVYDGFQREYGISKKEVKVMVNAVIASMPKLPELYGCEIDNMETVRVFSEHQFVKDLHSDLKIVVAKMKDMYPGYWNLMRHWCASRDKLEGAEGVALCMFAGDMEHSVMRAVIKELYGNKPENIVWKYDGVLVDKSKITSEPDVFLGNLSTAVKSKLDIHVRFALKDISFNSYPVCLPMSELAEDGSEYGRWKRDFEKTFFRVVDPPVYCMIRDDGSIMDMNDCQFKHNTMEQPQELIKQWKADPDKRMYKMKDFCPPPLVCHHSKYNTWTGLAYAKMENVEVPVDYDLEPYMKHVKLLMGNNDDHASYFHKLIAVKIQNPGYMWRVMPFIRSTPGVGKDVFFSFMEKMFGEVNCLRVGRVSEVMDKATHLLESKLLVCFSETEFQDNCKTVEVLKNAITLEKITVQKKYVNQYEIRNLACFMAFSNNFGAFQIPADDRRFFAVTADGQFANDGDYHQPLIKYLNDPKTIKAVGLWYERMDVTAFDSSKERPVTETFKEMASSSMSIMDMMIKSKLDLWIRNANFSSALTGCQLENETILRIPAKLFWDDFVQTCEENKVANCDVRNRMIKFGSRMLGESNARMKRYKTVDVQSDVIKSYSSHSRRFYKIDVPGLRKYITEMLSTEHDEEDEDINDGLAHGFNP